MMLLPILLVSALAGQGLSQSTATSASPSASSAATPCYVHCFSQFLVDMTDSCKTKCACAGSSLLSDFECCMTDCPADQQANMTLSVQNSCTDGKDLKLEYTCANTTPDTTTAAASSTPTALFTSIVLVSAQTAEGSAATGSAGGIGGGIGSDGGGGGASPTVGLGVGLGVGLPLAAAIVAGLAFLWKRSSKKRRGRGLDSRGGPAGGSADGVGRTFVFPSTMVLPTPGLSPGEAQESKDLAGEMEITPLEMLGDSRHRQELSV
ncbi:hypothetical protein CGCSCA5_v000086 [Colletotrichum siamense]|nr:hypothetical protein CGCSCA5_v000086 [Colletotrichum siamense]